METESETETELSGVTEEYICDDAGNPCIGSDGYALVKKETNKQGQVISERYYDLDKNPVICKKGYAQIRFEYDDAGHCIKQVVYDSRNKPVRIRKFEYNADGSKKKQYNYLPNGKLESTKVFEYILPK